MTSGDGMNMAAAIVFGYLLGSVPFAFIVARSWGNPGHPGNIDLRATGSGNVGATNVVRTAGLAAGIIVALLDIAKGAASVLLAERLDGSPAAAAAAGLAAIVGHVYPAWLRFHGGKGVATACGVFAVLTPIAAAVALAIFTVAVVVTRYVSLGSLLASAALPPIAYAMASPPVVVDAALAAAVLIVFRHRSNVARLVAGTERRLAPRAPV
jgi:acyl phosphate:glycerol-3-phosphate acyltransferase